MRMRTVCALVFIIFPVFLSLSPVFAGEECSEFHGICRDACAEDEEAAVGAFLDCTDKQDCCVKKEPQQKPSPQGAQGTPAGPDAK